MTKQSEEKLKLIKPTQSELEEKLSSEKPVVVAVENTKFSDRPFMLYHKLSWEPALKRFKVWRNYGQYPTHLEWGKEELKEKLKEIIAYQKEHKYLKISIPYEKEFEDRVKKEKLRQEKLEQEKYK